MAAKEEVVLKISGDAGGGVSALKQIGSALKGLWSDIKRLGGSAGIGGLSSLFGRLFNSVRGLGSSFGSALGGIGGIISRGLLSPLGLVKGALGPIGSAVSNLGGIFQVALGVVAGSAINTAVSSLKQLAAEPVMVAARVGVLETVLERIGATAGYTKEQLSGFVEGLKETGISTRQSLGNLTKMIQANLDLSKATQLARVAQDAAVIAGENSSETFAALIHGVTTLNSRILRQRGIIVDVVGEIKKWADANGMAAQDVDTATKQQIVFNAVLEAGARISGSYESAMTQVGKKLTSLPRYVEEAQLALGRGLTPILGAAVDILGDVLKKARKFFESIQPTLTAFSERVAAGLSSLYEKAQSVMADLGGVFARAKPYFEELGQIMGHYLPAVADRLRLFWSALKGAIGELAAAIGSHVPNMAGLWITFTDVVKATFEGVLKLLDGFRLLLKGRGEAAAYSFSEAMANGLAVIIILWEDYISKAVTWGYNLIASFASGIIQGASSLITSAANYVGSLIGGFFAAASPPKRGPLTGILEWGKGLINTYFQGFTRADFGILDQVGGHIKSALQSAVALGDLAEEEMVPVFRQVRELAAGLITDFRKTGEISEEHLGKISETLGEGGEDLVKYLRLQLEHQKALQNLAAVQDEYAAAEARGWIPAQLKEKLAAAKASAEEAQEELSWQEALIRAQQQGVDLQTQQMQVMERLADAVETVGDVIGNLGDDMEKIGTTIKTLKDPVDKVGSSVGKMGSKMGKALKGAEDPWDRFVSQYEEDMAVLEQKRALGLISEEEYLKGLEALQGRYVEQAIRMGKPYEAQLAALMQTRSALEALGAEPGAVAAPKIAPLALPKVDTSQMKADIDAGIRDAFSGVSERFKEAKEKGKALLGRFVQGARETLSNLPGIIRTWLGNAISALREKFPIVDTIITKFEEVKAWFDENWPTIAGVILTTWTIIRETIGSVVDVLVNTVWPKLEEAFATLQETMDQLGISWGDVWRALLKATAVVLVVLGTLLLALVGVVVGVVNAIASVASNLVRSWQRVLAGIKKILEGAIQFFYGWKDVFSFIFTGDLPRAWQGFLNMIRGGVRILSGLWDTLAGAVGITAGSVVAFIEGMVEGIIEFFKSLAKRLVGGSIIPDLVESILSWIENLYEGTIGWIVDLIERAIELFEDLKAQALAKIRDLKDRAIALARDLRDFVLEKVRQLHDSFIEKVRALKESVLAKFQELRDTATEYIETLRSKADEKINLIKGYFDGVKTAIGNVITKLAEFVTSFTTNVSVPGWIGNFSSAFEGIKGAIESVITKLTGDEGFIASLTQEVSIPEWISNLSTAFEGIKTAIGDALTKLNDFLQSLADAVGRIPDAFMPGSPTPFELGLRGIAETLKSMPDLTTQWLAGFDAHLAPATVASPAGMGGNTYQFYFGEGAFAGAFPGVRSGEDAQDFMRELSTLISQAAARAGVPGGVL